MSDDVAASFRSQIDQPGQDFLLKARRAPAVPVPSFRPRAPNSPIGLDIIPSGSVEFFDNGFSWIDACDSDILNIVSDETPVGCARMGIRNDRVEIGYRGFNGAGVKPVYLSINGFGYFGVLGTGQVVIFNLTVAADNSSASASGVPLNGIYRTGDGTLKVRF